MLEWLKTVLGDAYTPEIDTAVSQEIGKGFVARTDFNTKTAKVTELETEVKQLREGIKTRDTQLSELKKSAGDNAELQKQIDTLTQQNKDQKATYDKELATGQADCCGGCRAHRCRVQEQHRRPCDAGGLPQGCQGSGWQGHL